MLSLPHSEAAARTVRAHLAGVGAAWRPQVLHAALLLATEAVTNAVRHAPAAPVLVRIADDPERLGIEVVDAGTSPLPPARCQGGPMPHSQHLGGRGLPLFGLLSDGWGSQLEAVEDEGKEAGARHVVWFELAHGAEPLTRAAGRGHRSAAAPG
ncbi:ATP-binding protein [Quadrisphaera sp. KR29]|uniref:ATP-binding protein n=1 Tax=Quadrisphaera sp. KR29 TaxID=3461391 RepID=UPI004043ED44